MPQHPGSQWIMEHASELPTDIWIAATTNGELARHEKFDGLLEVLNQLPDKLHDVSIVLFTKDPVQ